VEFTANDQRRHLQMMQEWHQIDLLQNLAGSLKGLRVNVEQDFFALLDLFRMRGTISRRDHVLGCDFRAASEPTARFFLRHRLGAKAARPCGGNAAAASLTTSLDMRSGCASAKASATVPPKPLPISMESLAMPNSSKPSSITAI